MHAYYHHIGDYRKDTAHLSLVEHGIYRQLLDTYYTDEKPLTLDHTKLMRSHSVRTADEVRAFENVLQDFFDRTEAGYVHKRCESEIAQFKAKSGKASESAKARWAKEKKGRNADAMRSHTEGNANHKPVTSNHKYDAQARLDALGVSPNVLRDWMAMRKSQKATVTETVVDAIQREAGKAGITVHDALQICCERNWRGFKAEWLKPGHMNGHSPDNSPFA